MGIAVAIERRGGVLGPAQGPRTWGREHNAHDFLRFPHGPQRAPEPVAYGDTPSRPSRQWITFFLNIAGYRAVMADDFIGTVLFPEAIADRPRSYGNLPWRERANIARPQPEAYGSLVSEQLGQLDPFAPMVPA